MEGGGRTSAALVCVITPLISRPCRLPSPCFFAFLSSTGGVETGALLVAVLLLPLLLLLLLLPLRVPPIFP